MLEATLMLALVLGVFWLCVRAPKPCGRRVCMICKADLGPAKWLPAGGVTHGICKTCCAAFDADIDKPR